jgi:uncharacterized protein (TIGR02145 family)
MKTIEVKMKSIFLILFLYLTCYAQNPCPANPTIGYAGKTYHTVLIGSQCWLKENLDAGTRINGSADQSDNGTIEKYCANDNDTACSKYGGFYLWNEAMQYSTVEGSQGICPSGWHLPSNAEYTTLSASVGGDANKLKAVGQGGYGGVGNDLSGFSLILAGYRVPGGGFGNIDACGELWTSSSFDAANARMIFTYWDNAGISQFVTGKSSGFSVRCVQGNPLGINDLNNSELPSKFSLSQNYPNPFNPNTVISYSLPIASDIKLIVYNTLGQSVQLLESCYKPAGIYSINFNASGLPTGIYFCRMEAGQFSQITKMILIK